MNNNLQQSPMNLLTSPFYPEQTYNQSEPTQSQYTSHTSEEGRAMPQNITPSPQYEMVRKQRKKKPS